MPNMCLELLVHVTINIGTDTSNAKSLGYQPINQGSMGSLAASERMSLSPNQAATITFFKNVMPEIHNRQAKSVTKPPHVTEKKIPFPQFTPQ